MTKPVTRRKPKPVYLPEFTDGEWTVSGLAIITGEETTIAVASTSKREMAQCYRDLQLMAASKEMLQVCSTLLNVLNPDFHGIQAQGLIDLAKDALSKAGVKGVSA